MRHVLLAVALIALAGMIVPYGHQYSQFGYYSPDGYYGSYDVYDRSYDTYGYGGYRPYGHYAREYAYHSYDYRTYGSWRGYQTQYYRPYYSQWY